MKTKILLLGAVVTAFAVSTFAAGPLLSPRAASNQNQHMNVPAQTSTVAFAYVDTGAALLTPRLATSQGKLVKGSKADISSVQDCRKEMTGSPKSIAECASHPSAPMPCCNMTATK
jgi:hypothetical protein